MVWFPYHFEYCRKTVAVIVAGAVVLCGSRVLAENKHGAVVETDRHPLGGAEPFVRWTERCSDDIEKRLPITTRWTLPPRGRDPLGASAQSGQWTRFRGPDGSGIGDSKSIPTMWTASDYNWVTSLPGTGSSSPVVWRDRLFLTCVNGKRSERSILCVNTKDGTIRWKRDSPCKSYRLHRDNDFASATPTVDGDGVVVAWSKPEQLLLFALDLDGNETWRRDLGPFVGLHGFASSPIIADGLVVLANDQMSPERMKRYLPKSYSMVPGKSFLIAVDRKTGKTRWKVTRRTELAGRS